jgi:predicted nucleic acid-binding Zn ribbon protein
MPTYSLACLECGHTEDRRLAFTDYDKVKAGETILTCPKCTEVMQIGFQPSHVTFVLKDGPSGGWVSKAGKENKYRAARREVMAQRERDHVFKSHLQPNYKGEETGTWRAAQEEARKEVGEAAASTYTPLVASEGSST